MSPSADLHRSSFARSLSSIHLRHHLAEAEGLIDNERPNNTESNSKKRNRRVSESKSAQVVINRRRSGSPLSVISSDDLPPPPFTKEGRSSERQQVKRKNFQRRVSFDCDVESGNVPQQQRCSNKGYRKDYSLGDVARSPSHMIIEPTPEQAMKAADTLQKHDFAFIKRTDGSYSYAILACRSTVPVKGGEGDIEGCMTFVTDEAGSTKMIREKSWRNCVRLVSTDKTRSCSK